MARRWLALSGQRGAALAQYESCRRILREELGCEPDEATVELYEQIRSGELAAPAAITRRPLRRPIARDPKRTNGLAIHGLHDAAR